LKKDNKLNVPVQSLVSIPSKLIENFIGLIFTKDYNTSFFSKELNIPVSTLDFTITLSNLIIAKNAE